MDNLIGMTKGIIVTFNIGWIHGANKIFVENAQTSGIRGLLGYGWS